jgi:hypothetical protein
MADAPEIKVKLTAEDTGVSAAIKELTSQLKNLKKQQDETASSGISLKNAFAGIVAAAGALELGRIGKDAFDSAVNIGKMADKTGLTTQTLSVFHHVAEETSVSTEAVDKALTKAAKSITEFEQGSSKAAKGFQLLGITQKDFAGLKSDEKIALVTERLGHMSAGFQKATATQLIFSRGGAEFIPVANAIAGEGFDKVTESASRLGLLLDQKTTDSFRQAKAAMTELAAVGKGMATQFEAGLVPAITDVGKALTDSLTQGGVSFQDLGRYAGNAVKGIALIFLGLGQTIGTIVGSIEELFRAEFKEIANAAETVFNATGQAAHGHLSEAFGTLKQGLKNTTAIVSDEVDRQKAIYKSLGDSFKADYKNLFQSTPEKPPLRPDDQTEAPGITDDSAAKAHLSLLKQQLDQELALYREFEKVRLAVDQRQLEEGQLSLKDYFAVRRAEILAENQKEIQILEAQRALEKKEPAETEAAGIQKKAKIQALDAKIAEAREAQVLKLATLETEEFSKGEENRKKILEFHKLIDTTQGKALEAAKAEIAIEQQKLQIILAQSGASKAEIDQELARYAAVKTAQVEFTESQKDGEAALKQLADQRAEIEDRVKTGQLFQVQGEEQIRALEQARLPVLQQIADQLLAQAKATGDEQKITQAEDFQKQVSQIQVQANVVGQQIATIKQGLSGAITGGFTQFFGSLVQGTQSVGQAFRGLASSVISSLAQIAAQMIAQLILTKLLKSALGGFSGGGLVGGGGGSPAFAEGGLIRGPGGPKSDSIPARVSPGEYIVKADAVATFGVANLEAINRGLKIPSFERLALPKFADGGLVGNVGGGGGDSNINLGIGLDEGLILKHLSSRAAGNVILQHLVNNPKAASKALSRSD